MGTGTDFEDLEVVEVMGDEGEREKAGEVAREWGAAAV